MSTDTRNEQTDREAIGADVAELNGRLAALEERGEAIIARLAEVSA